jgi:hypothetical protein
MISRKEITTEETEIFSDFLNVFWVVLRPDVRHIIGVPYKIIFMDASPRQPPAWRFYGEEYNENRYMHSSCGG